ncbi:DUF881 domain-containing protein [Mobilicoccus caccae]|uniref:Membrane protein n=1 Tax=Mobilicoccus caccae TaxID=1859295 RepID=A0ABQ6IX91_9MICO|nr:DUF881 domain-containing protein [Mobilicoccus caccae]GMA41686.1 membrane protein [Mobilicoccus caccae]
MTRSPTRARRSVWTVVVPVITAIAGLLFATSAVTARGTDLRGADVGLPALIRDQASAVDRGTRANAALREEVRAMEAALPESAELARLRREQAELEKAGGMTAVAGPAVRVSLDDAGLTADSLPEGVSVDDVVVHQQDVQAVVNALWVAGAEAMTIQDQRVISTSAVRCVGNTLILGGRVYSPPFVITAIGDTRALQAGLDADPAVALYRSYVDRLGLGYQVEHLDVEFGGYTGTVDLDHARPARSATTTPPRGRRVPRPPPAAPLRPPA